MERSRYRIDVDKMTCGGCSGAITRALNKAKDNKGAIIPLSLKSWVIDRRFQRYLLLTFLWKNKKSWWSRDWDMKTFWRRSRKLARRWVAPLLGILTMTMEWLSSYRFVLVWPSNESRHESVCWFEYWKLIEPKIEQVFERAYWIWISRGTMLVLRNTIQSKPSHLL